MDIIFHILSAICVLVITVYLGYVLYKYIAFQIGVHYNNKEIGEHALPSKPNGSAYYTITIPDRGITKGEIKEIEKFIERVMLLNMENRVEQLFGEGIPETKQVKTTFGRILDKLIYTNIQPKTVKFNYHGEKIKQ